MKASAPTSSRRNFLLALGAGGLATAATIAAKASGGPIPVAVPEPKKQDAGYRHSEHNSNYYRTAKV